MRSRAVAVAASLASVVALAAICVPAAGAARAKPDLVVKGFQFKSSPPNASAPLAHVVLDADRHGLFSIVFTIKNQGAARAHASMVRVVANRGVQIGEIPIRALAPGAAVTVRKAFRTKFTGPGRGKVFVCADFGPVGSRVNESNERNNCSRDIFFRTIPRRWTVGTFSTGPNSLTGIAPFFDAHSTGMTFEFEAIVAHDGQRYFTWLARGGVQGATSGNDGLCSYTGNGSVSHVPWDIIPPVVGYLEISHDQSSYYAEIHDDDYSFTTTQTCTGFPPYDSTGPLQTLETVDSAGFKDQDMEENDRTLSGSYTIPTGFGTGSAIGSWAFTADL
jgi:hypothetical protein